MTNEDDDDKALPMTIAEKTDYGTRANETHKELMRPVANSEEALNATGGFGAYQVMIVIGLQLIICQFAGNVAFMSFATYLPDVKCFATRGQPPLLMHGNNNSFEGNDDFCEAYDEGDCREVQYHAAFGTIIAEWDLICASNYVPETINSLQQVGSLTTVFGVGLLSDKFGRKTVFMLCYIMLIAVDMLASITTNLVLFTVCRCCIGALYHACSSVAFVWCMEVVVRRRSVVMNLANSWYIGYIIVGIIGYLTRQWRMYLAVLNVLGAPMIIFFGLFVVESPRWLVQKGQIDKAVAALRWIGRVNNSTSASTLDRHTIESIDRDSQHKLSTLEGITMLGEGKLRTYLISVSILMFTATTVNHTYILHLSLLPGDPTVKIIIYGLARVPIALISFLLDRRFEWFGRRKMTLLPLTIIAICHGLNLLNRNMRPSFTHDWPVDMVTMLTAAVMCSMLWVGIYAFMVELFPTVIRNTAFAVIIVAESLAGIIVPQLVYMEEMYIPDILVILCVLLAVNGIAITAALLPETKGKPIPEHFVFADTKTVE